MRKDITIFREELNIAIEDCRRFCFMSRAREFQLEKCNILQSFKETASSLKENAISENDEDSANAALSLEDTIDSTINELKMWIALKDDNPNLAWQYLIQAEAALRQATQAHPIASYLEKEALRLDQLEKLLFQPMVFLSPGMIIKDSECSICGERYGECSHIRGRAYMGEHCRRIIKDIVVEEVSFVESPANKNCRVTALTDDSGLLRDFLTWRLISSPEEH